MTKLLTMLLGSVQKLAIFFLVSIVLLALGSYLLREIGDRENRAAVFEEARAEWKKAEKKLADAEEAYAKAQKAVEIAKKAKGSINWVECNVTERAECKEAKAKIKAAKDEEQEKKNTFESAKRSEAENKDIFDLRMKEDQEFKKKHWLDKYVIPFLIPALLVTLGVLFVPLLIKLALYFWLAPVTKTREPLRLVPDAGGGEFSPSVGTQSRISAVSQSIVLNEGEELLIHPEYLQSTPQDARKKTQLFLNRAIPLSSMSAGLFLLTRIADARTEPIVVSSTKDALGEVGILELREGDAFVCHARALAGIIQDSRKPMNISRLWRFGHLQSWLTLQFRYIVFHGPGKLIIKGCRGIRMEAASHARLINQSATLGFSANLGYSSIRCETFMSYLTGQEDLLNDRFFGEPGVYVFEEIPATGKGGVRGRLEGVIDSILKVFGV